MNCLNCNRRVSRHRILGIAHAKGAGDPYWCDADHRHHVTTVKKR